MNYASFLTQFVNQSPIRQGEVSHYARIYDASQAPLLRYIHAQLLHFALESFDGLADSRRRNPYLERSRKISGRCRSAAGT